MSQLLKRLHCWLTNHRLEVWQVFTPWSRRVICTRCGGDWGMNDEVRSFIPWNGELEDVYRVMGKTIRRRS